MAEPEALLMLLLASNASGVGVKGEAAGEEGRAEFLFSAGNEWSATPDAVAATETGRLPKVREGETAP